MIVLQYMTFSMKGKNIYVKKTSDTRYNLIMDVITVTQVRPNASVDS